MARITATTSKLYDQLVTEDAWSLSASQLQSAVEGRLGPVHDAPDPAEHWRTLETLAAGPSRRLPTHDGAAIDLAIAGYPCLRLPSAIKTLIATDEPPQDPDQVAEDLMAAAQAPGDDKQYVARFGQRMLSGATARSGSAGENARLERLGQAQAVAAGLSEVAEGGRPTDSLDPEDVAQVFGMPVELVSAFLSAFELIFGNHDILGAVGSLIEDAELATLALAVRGGAAIVPLFENAVVRFDTSSDRTRFIAQVAPLLLIASELHGVIVAQAGSADLAAALPSMFDAGSPSVAQAWNSLSALLPSPPTAVPEVEER